MRLGRVQSGTAAAIHFTHRDIQRLQPAPICDLKIGAAVSQKLHIRSPPPERSAVQSRLPAVIGGIDVSAGSNEQSVSRLY